MAYRIVWDFAVPNNRIPFKGSYSDPYHPLSMKDAQAMASELNRTWGEDSHWIEEIVVDTSSDSV